METPGGTIHAPFPPAGRRERGASKLKGDWWCGAGEGFESRRYERRASGVFEGRSPEMCTLGSRAESPCLRGEEARLRPIRLRTIRFGQLAKIDLGPFFPSLGLHTLASTLCAKSTSKSRNWPKSKLAPPKDSPKPGDNPDSLPPSSPPLRGMVWGRRGRAGGGGVKGKGRNGASRGPRRGVKIFLKGGRISAGGGVEGRRSKGGGLRSSTFPSETPPSLEAPSFEQPPSLSPWS